MLVLNALNFKNKKEGNIPLISLVGMALLIPEKNVLYVDALVLGVIFCYLDPRAIRLRLVQVLFLFLMFIGHLNYLIDKKFLLISVCLLCLAFVFASLESKRKLDSMSSVYYLMCCSVFNLDHEQLNPLYLMLFLVLGACLLRHSDRKNFRNNILILCLGFSSMFYNQFAWFGTALYLIYSLLEKSRSNILFHKINVSNTVTFLLLTILVASMLGWWTIIFSLVVSVLFMEDGVEVESSSVYKSDVVFAILVLAYISYSIYKLQKYNHLIILLIGLAFSFVLEKFGKQFIVNKIIIKYFKNNESLFRAYSGSSNEVVKRRNKYTSVQDVGLWLNLSATPLVVVSVLLVAYIWVSKWN